MSLGERLKLEWDLIGARSDVGGYFEGKLEGVDSLCDFAHLFYSRGYHKRAISLSKRLINNVCDNHKHRRSFELARITRSFDRLMDLFIVDSKYQEFAELCERGVEAVSDRTPGIRTKNTEWLLTIAYRLYSLAGEDKSAEKIKTKLKNMKMHESEFEISLPAHGELLEKDLSDHILTRCRSKVAIEKPTPESRLWNSFLIGCDFFGDAFFKQPPRRQTRTYLQYARRYYENNSVEKAFELAEKTFETALEVVRKKPENVSYWLIGIISELENIYLLEDRTEDVAKMYERCAVELGLIIDQNINSDAEYFLTVAAKFYKEAGKESKAVELAEKINVSKFFYYRHGQAPELKAAEATEKKGAVGAKMAYKANSRLGNLLGANTSPAASKDNLSVSVQKPTALVQQGSAVSVTGPVQKKYAPGIKVNLVAEGDVKAFEPPEEESFDGKIPVSKVIDRIRGAKRMYESEK